MINLPLVVKFRLAQLMADRDIHTVKELAPQCGIDETTLGKIKRNRVAMISLKNINRLCAALKCAPGDLLSYEADP